MSDTNQPSNEDTRPADDLLRGAKEIGDFIGVDEDEVYYIVRSGKGGWPIGRDGVQLIASRKRLSRHASKITQPTS